jgi:hypothetical protein
MLIRRTSNWILGTAMAAAAAHFTNATRRAQTFADAFEPDLDAWEYIPVMHPNAELAS